MDGLLSFGEDGVTCATEVCVACPVVSEKVIAKIVDRIFRETYSGGMTIMGAAALTRLCWRRQSVAKRLIEEICSGREFFDSAVQCAECLLDSGRLPDAFSALEFIAKNEHGYHGDRVRASGLLLENGRRVNALKVLADMAENADEVWTRADAAAILFKHDRSVSNRKLISEILKEDADDDLGGVHESTLAGLLSIGEKSLVLPILRERAMPPARPGYLSEMPRSQIEACKAIASYHDRNEAALALKVLFSWSHASLRGKAEVLEGLADIGFEDDARKLLTDMIGAGPGYVGSDWFVLELLGRFNLEVQIQSVGLYLLRLSLNGKTSGQSVADIVGRLLPHVSRNELASCLREKSHLFENSDTIACLATLGFREEAFARLKSHLRSADFSARVDAAEALCSIGERKLGIQTLNRIVKSPNVEFSTRLTAIDSLRRVDEIAAADKASIFLIRDERLSIENRCNVARSLGEDRDRASETIWDVMFPRLIDEVVSLEEKIAISKLLLTVSPPEWGDYEDEDVVWVLIDILEDEAVSAVDAWRVAGVLASERYSIRELPRVAALVEDSSIPLSVRINGLRSFVIYSDDGLAAQKIIEYSRCIDVPYADAIEALVSVLSVDLRQGALDQIRAIARDKSVPPKWRLKAAEELEAKGRDISSKREIVEVIEDIYVSVQERLSAIDKLVRISDAERVALIISVSRTPQLCAWDRIQIAEALVKVQAIEFVRGLLDEVISDVPLSPVEMTSVARLLQSIGSASAAVSMLEKIVGLPDVILEEIEDVSFAVEAAEMLAGAYGEAEKAELLLRRLLSVVGWWQRGEVLTGIAEIVGEDAARRLAHDMMSDIVAELAKPPDEYIGDWLYLLETFLRAGWITDLSLLNSVLADSNRRLSDRIHAAAAMYRHGERDVSKEWVRIVQNKLTEIAADETASVHDRLNLISALSECGLKELAREKVNVLRSSGHLSAGERKALGKCLADLGDRAEARTVLEDVASSQDASDRLFSRDERVIKPILGDERFKEIQLSSLGSDEKDGAMRESG